MSIAVSQQTVMDGAVRHLVSKYNPQGNRVGWLMMASILVEAWDLYSIAFVLVFIREQYHPEPLLLGLAAAGTQGGAVIGALLGGWLSDKLGRRVMFLSTMWMFIIFALLQAVVPSEVLEVLGVEGGQRELVRQTACSDPGVVYRPRSAAPLSAGLELAPANRDPL